MSQTAIAKAPLILRAATVEDLARLGTLACEFYAETKFARDVFSLDRFMALWKSLIESGMGVIFLLFSEDVPIGALGAVAHQEPYSDSVIAQEMFMFINKDHRCGSGMLRLLRSYEQWAKERGCSQVRIAHLQDLQPERLGALYERRGYEPVEVSYARQIK